MRAVKARRHSLVRALTVNRYTSKIMPLAPLSSKVSIKKDVWHQSLYTFIHSMVKIQQRQTRNYNLQLGHVQATDVLIYTRSPTVRRKCLFCFI